MEKQFDDVSDIIAEATEQTGSMLESVLTAGLTSVLDKVKETTENNLGQDGDEYADTVDIEIIEDDDDLTTALSDAFNAGRDMVLAQLAREIQDAGFVYAPAPAPAPELTVV